MINKKVIMDIRNLLEPYNDVAVLAALTERMTEDAMKDGGDPVKPPEGVSVSNMKATYDIICDGCGNEAKVNFKPHEGRDVYCRECYFNPANRVHKDQETLK